MVEPAALVPRDLDPPILGAVARCASVPDASCGVDHHREVFKRDLDIPHNASSCGRVEEYFAGQIPIMVESADPDCR